MGNIISFVMKIILPVCILTIKTYAQDNDYLKFNKQELIKRFLHVDFKDKQIDMIINDMKKTESKNPFIAAFAKKYGFPEWKFIISGNEQKNFERSEECANYFFIPFRDSLTKMVKCYLFCQKFNDTLFRYTIYDVDKILNFDSIKIKNPINKHVVIAVASFFEKKINGAAIRPEFKKGLYKDVIFNKTFYKISDANSNKKNDCSIVNTYQIEIPNLNQKYALIITIPEKNNFAVANEDFSQSVKVIN